MASNTIVEIAVSEYSEMLWIKGDTALYSARVTRCIAEPAKTSEGGSLEQKKLRVLFEGVIPAEGKFSGRLELQFDSALNAYHGGAVWQFASAIGREYKAHATFREIAEGEWSGIWTEHNSETFKVDLVL